jgi:protein-disulfide isomerase
VLENYPEKVKLVHKDAPIPGHPLSRPAAIAALAAGEQKKYWEYHDKIMQNMSALGPESFLEFAKELGLDIDSFQKSLADPKHEKHLEKDAQDAINADVQGRPTIFVNGRVFNNTHTLDAFKVRIDEELKKKKK